jgi:ribosomal protein S7
MKVKRLLKIKSKLTTHVVIGGGKKTSEKILLKSFKELQKTLTKDSEKLFRSAVLKSLPIFQTHVFYNKDTKQTKELPRILRNKSSRVSKSIKFILQNDKKTKNSIDFYIQFKENVILASRGRSEAVIKKNEEHTKALKLKKYLRHFRWT